MDYSGYDLFNANFSVECFVKHCSYFSSFIFGCGEGAIAFSDLLWLTASDNIFGTSKLFFIHTTDLCSFQLFMTLKINM